MITIIKKKVAEDAKAHHPGHISTSNLDPRVKNPFLSVLSKVNVYVQAVCVCVSVCTCMQAPEECLTWEKLHSITQVWCGSVCTDLNWKPVGARVNSKHWGLSECLQKEIAGAPLLGLAKAQLEKAAGNNIWYGRNNIVAARRWIRWVKRFFHFLTSVISCARDDLNFFP